MPGRRLSIRQAARLLEIGAVTSEELVSYCHSLALVGDEVWGLNAYERIVSKDDVLDRAKESDVRRTHGESLSILDGLPISVKSNLAVADQPLTAGSQILGMNRPEIPAAGYDADVVQRLVRDAGSIVVGMTSMDEFGMGSLGNTSSHSDGTARVTKNPLPLLQGLPTVAGEDEAIVDMIRSTKDAMVEEHSLAKEKIAFDEIYSAGGSSCGSAASVAHGSALLSLGTDTGGSVRLPSAWCGLVGLKPSYGLLSRHGLVSYASSFDTVGILANSVDCATVAFDLLTQRDDFSRDSTFSSLPVHNSAVVNVENENLLAGIRIGVPAAFSVRECPSSIQQAWSDTAESLHSQGATVEEIPVQDIDPDLVQRALAAYYVLVSGEASSNLSRYDAFRYGTRSETRANNPEMTPLEEQYAASRKEGFGAEVSRRVLCGTSVLSSSRFHTHYEGAAKLRAVLAGQLHSVLAEKVDALLIPTALSFPARLDQHEADSTAMFANDIMTVPASLAGLPALSVPVHVEGMGSFKAAMSLIGSRLDEATILRIGRVLETTSI